MNLLQSKLVKVSISCIIIQLDNFKPHISTFTHFLRSVLSSESDKLKLLKEVSLMLSFKHPNLMSLIGLCFDGDVPLVIMPFMSGGSVLDYVRQNRDNLYLTAVSSQEKVMCTQVGVCVVYVFGYVHCSKSMCECAH